MSPKMLPVCRRDRYIKMRYCFIIGSSRGLGAALVEELLKKEDLYVIGFARSDIADIKNADQWLASKRYQHVKIDITSPECTEKLKSICSGLSGEPIIVIHNAALVKSDSSIDKRIDYPIFDEINHIAIAGLRRVLEGIEEHMLSFGGVFVGISSFSAIFPPAQELRLAYPATKAYLDMALRCLRFAWGNKVKIVTVHLGHLDSLGDGKRYWFVPNYAQTARKIAQVLGRTNIPDEINYPFLYNLLYRRLLIFVPDYVYFWIINLLTKFIPEQKK